MTRGTIAGDDGSFPVSHYSYSSLTQFTTNPILFKIKYINRDKIDTTSNISGVIGRAFHYGMELYWGYDENDEAGAIELGLSGAMEYLEEYNDGWIEYSKTVQTKQKALEVLAFCYNSYVKEKPRGEEQTVACEQEINEIVDIEWRGQRLTLPVPLKGYLDRITRQEDGKLIIRDYKTCYSFSDPDKIDGKKIIQAVQYYLLAYAFYGEEPYSVVFEEVKTSKNRDNSKQTREYEIVFADNDLFFDFYFRLYDDVTRALSGEAVFVPNVEAFYDNEVAIISYIHRLDMSEEQAALMKKHKVDNLTALLKEKIQTAGNMRKLMKTVERKFVSARNLNYDRMKNEEKIATKLMEHGLMVQFHSVIDGATVQLYQYTPSVGLKMGRMASFAPDIEQVLGKSGIRVLAPIPNSTMIGFEVPKDERYFPALPEHDKTFNLAMGQTIMGETKRFDIREAPHMLVAGATGSGKSVFLTSIIEQLMTVSNVDLHLYDPKQVEFAMYEGKVREYQCEPEAINDSLVQIVNEMEMRYQQLRKAGTRSIEQMPKMRYKVVVIDEYNDLAMNMSDVARNVLLLAQKARAAGIHVIIATQRPSTDVISGTIKANFPTKAVFRVAKEVDSRIVLDMGGAEKLMGKGDMLFSSDAGVERLQGFNV